MMSESTLLDIACFFILALGITGALRRRPR